MMNAAARKLLNFFALIRLLPNNKTAPINILPHNMPDRKRMSGPPIAHTMMDNNITAYIRRIWLSVLFFLFINRYPKTAKDANVNKYIISVRMLIHNGSLTLIHGYFSAIRKK